MAPITEQHVESLKDHIHKLEARIWELEQRLQGGGTKVPKPDSMRMILIGPPGAGKWLLRCAISSNIY